ncbi:MAG: methyl-accepting chemotaxis protein [Clostridiales bacterium]|nr:methyl-accepting chemotaxis protein [Clostridiales bacterium]
MKKFQFKSLKQQLILTSTALILIISVGLALTSMFISKNALVKTVNMNLPEIAKEAASSVENAINTNLTILEVVSENKILKDETVPLSEKLNLLAEVKKSYNYLGVSFVDSKGNLTDTDGNSFNIADQDSFKKAMSGIKNISDPIISKTDKSMIVLYTVPIKNSSGTVIGCVSAARSGDEISNYSNSIKLGKTGQAFIIDNKGTIIAHNNKQLVFDMYNPIEESKKDSSLKALAEIEKKMINKETSSGEYVYKGVSKYVGYAPIKNTDWAIGIMIEKKEILKELTTLQIWIAIASIAFIILGAIFMIFVAKSLSTPIGLAINELDEISQGNLSEETSDKLLNRQDELGKMAKAIESMRNTMKKIIGDIKQSADNIGAQTDYLSSVSEKMYASSQNINAATNEVARGSVTQAEDLSDITTIIHEFSAKLENIVELIKDVELNTNTIKDMADKSNNDMENAVKSIENVNVSFNDLVSKSQEVGTNITKINAITNLINSIAEQTNLLALNAAIEAARAGEAGRGFTVVADEIRKLAEQSKVSSENIANLLSEVSKDTSVMVNTTEVMKKELENQMKDIYTAIESFKSITNAVDEIAPKMAVTTKSIEELNNDKDNILNKIESASAVSEEVSASAEEIAASTQEMSSSSESLAESVQQLNDMSKNMMELVGKFKV